MGSVIVIGRNYSTLLGVIRAAGSAGYNVKVLKLVRRIPKKASCELNSKWGNFITTLFAMIQWSIS